MLKPGARESAGLSPTLAPGAALRLPAAVDPAAPLWAWCRPMIRLAPVLLMMAAVASGAAADPACLPDCNVGGCRFRFDATAGAPGDAGRCDDGGAIVGGERIGLAPAPARRLAGEALQNATYAIMAGRIIGAGVDVAGADRGAERAHGGRGGAIGNPLGEVGGDCQRIGGQGIHLTIPPHRPTDRGHLKRRHR